MSSAEAAADFFAKYWPEAQAIGDPQQTLYREFGIKFGSLLGLLKPRVWKAFWANRHHGIGCPHGNTMRNPGVLLIEDQQVTFAQSARDFAMQVDVEAIRQLSENR